MTRRAPLAVFLVLLLGSALPARADELPELPLPDCVANGLPLNAVTDCEGTFESYVANPEIPRPEPGAVRLAISAREVDFRLDADRPGPAQLLTFSFTFPGDQQSTAPDGTLYRSKVGTDVLWRETFVAFAGLFFGCKQAGEPWSGGCDGAPEGTGPNPDRVQLVRQGDCPQTAASCTYRVVWGPYDRRVREPMIYRVGVEFFGRYTEERLNGLTPCGTDLLTSPCGLGGGTAYVTYATTPPPPLNAVAAARRRGPRVFEFDGSGSNPDVVRRKWTIQVPDIVAGGLRSIVSEQSVFTLDFDEEANIPGSFFEAAHVAQLEVTDRWDRTEFAFVEYSFLAPAGTEGPLEISSLVLVDVDDDGLATLKAVVKNTGTTPITDVFLLGTESLGQLSPKTTPILTTIEPDATIEFTITVQFDARDALTIEAQAFGTSSTGSAVKSPPKSKQFDRDGNVKASTRVSQASLPGDHVLQVESNDGFNPGDYVVIDLAGPNFEARPIQALGSLVFDAPLAKPHAVGEVVEVFPNTPETGDVVPPTVVVTAPVEGAFVCQGTPLVAAFTCTDPAPAAGVETCGEGITNGQPLDTATAGPRQTTIRAWDIVGNVTTKVVSWTVGPCATDIDAFRCYQAKPSSGAPKFVPILGVRVNGAFDDVIVDLKKPVQLCAPSDVAADGLLDPETHLEAFTLKLQKGLPKPVARKGVTVATQVGTLTVDTGKPAQVLLPTAEDPVSSPNLTANEVDRFTCYAAKLAKGQPKLPKDLQVTVADQFTSPPKRVTLKKIVRLCTPVGVSGGPTKHDARLLCFQVAQTKGRCAEAAPANPGGGCKQEADCGGMKGATTLCAVQAKFAAQTGRNVANDLTTGLLDLKKEDVLCLPAVAVP